MLVPYPPFYSTLNISGSPSPLCKNIHKNGKFCWDIPRETFCKCSVTSWGCLQIPGGGKIWPNKAYNNPPSRSPRPPPPFRGGADGPKEEAWLIPSPPGGHVSTDFFGFTQAEKGCLFWVYTERLR